MQQTWLKLAHNATQEIIQMLT